jgi:hypothetical protein
MWVCGGEATAHPYALELCEQIAIFVAVLTRANLISKVSADKGGNESTREIAGWPGRYQPAERSLREQGSDYTG